MIAFSIDSYCTQAVISLVVGLALRFPSNCCLLSLIKRYHSHK